MRDNLHWFTHSAQSAREPRVQALIAKYGMEGYGRYWILLERIASSPECALEVAIPLYRNTLANDMRMNTKDLEEFLSFLTNPDECGLLEMAEGKLTSRTISEDYQRASEDRRKARERRQRALNMDDMEVLEVRGNVGEPSPKKTTHTGHTGHTGQTDNTNKQGCFAPSISHPHVVDNSLKMQEVVKEEEELEVRGNVGRTSGEQQGNVGGTEGKMEGLAGILRKYGLSYDPEYLQAIKEHLANNGLGIDYLNYVYGEVKKKEPSEIKPYYFKALFWPDLIERFHEKKRRNGSGVLR